MSFVIHTDSACDIRPQVLSKWGVSFSPLTFRFDGSDKEYTEADLPIKEFYDKMRNGAVAKTSAINIAAFKEAFETILKQGQDILYLAFSSGLSTTCNSAKIACEELLQEYPERKIIVVDTLAASAGQGLIVKLTVDKKNEGASLEETASYAQEISPKMAHWFTVDDLVYLKRGGRISAATALVGGVLGIKPILHVDDEGHLIGIGKVRGRKPSLMALAKKYTELAEHPESGTVFLCQGDCKEDAEFVAGLIQKTHGIKVELITDIGPVIGAHSGPGTLAIFFIGKER